MVDWADTELDAIVTVYQVDAHDKGAVIGTLPIDSAAISHGYYTDTRASAKLTTWDADQLIPGAWLRVTMEVAGERFDLFTGFITGVDEDYQPGGVLTSLELSSTLKALETDVSTELWCVAPGATVKQAMRAIMGRSGMPWRFTATAGDYRFTEQRLYDPGEAWLSILYDLAGAADIRIEVDGRGDVVLDGYRAPSVVSPAWVLDADSPRSVVLSATASRATDQYERPNRSLVVWKDDEADRFITGYADLPALAPNSAARRGVTVTEVHELQDMPEPHSMAQAQRLAQQYLVEDAAATVEWSATIMLDGSITCGSVGLFGPGNGQTVRKVMVKDMDVDPLGMRMNLTLKEV